jgi:hypothetical protein
MLEETFLLTIQRRTCSSRMSVRSEIGNDGKATHNIKNYLHVPWKKVLQEWNRPLLKSLLYARSQDWLQVILLT